MLASPWTTRIMIDTPSTLLTIGLAQIAEGKACGELNKRVGF